MSARKLDFYLRSSESLRALTHQARRLAELQQAFVKTAPPYLAQACYVKSLSAGTLIVLAENAAIAAKLKQLSPRLLAAYQKLRPEVTSIQVEVQVATARDNAAAQPTAKILSPESI